MLTRKDEAEKEPRCEAGLFSTGGKYLVVIAGRVTSACMACQFNTLLCLRAMRLSLQHDF